MAFYISLQVEDSCMKFPMIYIKFYIMFHNGGNIYSEEVMGGWMLTILSLQYIASRENHEIELYFQITKGQFDGSIFGQTVL